jgi:Tfp pilus assembly protein PilP
VREGELIRVREGELIRVREGELIRVREGELSSPELVAGGFGNPLRVPILIGC